MCCFDLQNLLFLCIIKVFYEFSFDGHPKKLANFKEGNYGTFFFFYPQEKKKSRFFTRITMKALLLQDMFISSM